VPFWDWVVAPESPLPHLFPARLANKGDNGKHRSDGVWRVDNHEGGSILSVLSVRIRN
jgi:hypothetical protein